MTRTETWLTVCGLSLIGLVAVALWGIPRIEMRLALMPRAEVANPPHPRIAMVGDSLTYMPDWSRLTGCASIGNYGVTGNTTGQVLDRLPAIIESKPEFVFVMAGTNDGELNLPVDSAISNLEHIAAMLRDHRIEYVILNPPPLPGHENFISKLSTVSSLKIDFDVNDLGTDQVHLRGQGYIKWLHEIDPIIQQVCKDTP